MIVPAVWVVVLVGVALVLTASAAKRPSIAALAGRAQTFVFVAAALWLLFLAATLFVRLLR